MPVNLGELLEANWDHLPPPPQPPKQPPSKLQLAIRKAMLAIRPEFTYGDHRDKLQRQETKRAKRHIERDEAWAKKMELRAQHRAARQKKKNGPGGFGLGRSLTLLREKRAATKTQQARAMAPGSSHTKVHIRSKPVSTRPAASPRRSNPRIATTRPIVSSKSVPQASPRAHARPSPRHSPRSGQPRSATRKHVINIQYPAARPWAALEARVVAVGGQKR